MKIAVDIDDTLNVVDRFGRAGAYIARNNLPYRVKDENSNFFVNVYDWDEEAVLKFIRGGGIAAFTEAEAKKGAAEALRLLREAGHEIVILTARQKAWFGNPVNLSRDWLEKRKIPYDEIVAEVWDKGAYCADRRIEILVDDNPDICLEAEKRGVHTVLFLGKHNLSRASSFRSASTWKAAGEQISFLSEIILHERLTELSNPARRTELLGGFRLSFDETRGRRGNCARRALPSNEELGETLMKIEAKCAADERVCRFLLTEADALFDRTLEERGYRKEVTESCYTLRAKETPFPAHRVSIAEEPDAEWRAALAAAEGGYTGYFTPRSYALARGTCIFASVYDGAVPVGAAAGVLAEGRVGVFDLRVAKDYRRRGYGRALTETIISEGAIRGATEAYAHTETGNYAATALFRSMGFTKIYDDWYRVK